MKNTFRLLALLLVFGLSGYGFYRKGYSVAASEAGSARQAEYGNDWNSDSSAKHSVSYSLGYARGHGAGYAETRQSDFFECGEKLAQLAVDSGDPKVAGRLLASGDVALSQLEEASRSKPKR
jgi:hypothetical protein